MPRYTLRPAGRFYDLLLNGEPVGLVYPEGERWALALTSVAARPDACWQSFSDVPARLRTAAGDDYATVLDLCAAVGVSVGATLSEWLRAA